MTDDATTSLFPSGPWTGFFLDKRVPGRHAMELHLTFAAGRMTGEGRDRVGEFTIDGVYDPSSGRCSWQKRYVRRHVVHYSGFNEGKGIWGTWTLGKDTGGFHIWPEGMADPTVQRLSEEADLPAVAPPATADPELEPQPAG